MEETKRLLVENSHLPMSIILVGVGRGDMSKMDILDDDNRTMSWNGRRSERDIVQFVEMSKYLPDQCLDPFTFHSVMDAANAKYHLARVRSRNSRIINIPYSITFSPYVSSGRSGRDSLPSRAVLRASRDPAGRPRRQREYQIPTTQLCNYVILHIFSGRAEEAPELRL